MKNVFPEARLNRSLNDWANDVNQLVESLMGAVTPPQPTTATNATNEFSPRMDVRESADQYVLSIDLPGVRREDTEIELANEQLVVRGTRNSVVHSDDDRYHRVERTFGAFRRTIRLPKDVDVERVSADYTDGVLNVYLPKTQVTTARKIEIAGGN